MPLLPVIHETNPEQQPTQEQLREAHQQMTDYHKAMEEFVAQMPKAKVVTTLVESEEEEVDSHPSRENYSTGEYEAPIIPDHFKGKRKVRNEQGKALTKKRQGEGERGEELGGREQDHSEELDSSAYNDPVDAAKSTTPKRKKEEKQREGARLVTMTEDELEKKMQNMLEKKLAESAGVGGPSTRRGASRHPFTDDVMEANVPSNFQLPHIASYDGRGDPLDHLSQFNAATIVYGLSDGASCKAFPASLKGPAQVWYSDLKPGSVGKFEELAAAFTSRFQSSIRSGRTTASLKTMKQ